jgi:peptidoglycan hydrolase-like protein with peptidoglycan-binding domain
MINLKYGDWTTPVMTLQRNLQKLGYGSFIPTGFFGAKTQSAVKVFQESYGLPTTGVYGNAEDSKMQYALSNFNREKIYRSAIAFLGIDASPNDLAPDEFGCADSVCGVLQKALGKDMGIDWSVSTSILERELAISKGYMLVATPQRGDILISSTGKGNGKLANGHTGIWLDNYNIASNNSSTGRFEENYNASTWKDRYVDIGGFPMHTYRKL